MTNLAKKTTRKFRVSADAMKAITAEGRRVARCGRVRCGMMRWWTDTHDDESTFNIDGVTQTDVDDRYTHVYSPQDFNRHAVSDPRLLLDRVVLDVEVSTWAGDFWEPNDWIHPVFENGRLIGFDKGQGGHAI